LFVHLIRGADCPSKVDSKLKVSSIEFISDKLCNEDKSLCECSLETIYVLYSCSEADDPRTELNSQYRK